MTTEIDRHGWFRRRLPVYLAGLMPEDEEQRFLEHRDGCEPCRRAFDEFTASDELAPTGDGSHIPAAMLAQWPEASRELVGLERAMVRSHLERCAACRRDLELIGQTPELKVVPGLEADLRAAGWKSWFSGGPWSGAARVDDSEPEPTNPARQPRRRRWVPWALGGWAAAATAAAVLLVLSPLPRTGVPSEPSSPAAVAIPPSGSRLVLEASPAAPTLQGATRGVTANATAILVGREAHFVRFALPELYLPDTATVDLTVVGPDGTSLAALRCLSSELNPPHALLLGHPDANLASGTYRLAITAPFPARHDVAAFEFRLVR